MPRIVVALAAALLATLAVDRAPAQVGFAHELTVSWEVKNRFRLFRYESDFLKHVDADRGDGILTAEQRLAQATDGQGWARTLLNGLCVDPSGKVVEICERDGEKEAYLTPTDHRVGVLVPNAPAGSSCAWTFDNGQDPPQAVPRGSAPARPLWAAHPGDRRHSPARRHDQARDGRDPGARPADRGLGRLGRLGRRQSRPPDCALRRGILLPPFSRHRAQ